MRKMHKVERYFYVAIFFIFATFFAKSALEGTSTAFAIIKSIISIAFYMYGVYLVESFIEKEIERKYFTEDSDDYIE